MYFSMNCRGMVVSHVLTFVSMLSLVWCSPSQTNPLTVMLQLSGIPNVGNEASLSCIFSPVFAETTLDSLSNSSVIFYRQHQLAEDIGAERNMSDNDINNNNIQTLLAWSDVIASARVEDEAETYLQKFMSSENSSQESGPWFLLPDKSDDLSVSFKFDGGKWIFKAVIDEIKATDYGMYQCGIKPPFPGREVKSNLELLDVMGSPEIERHSLMTELQAATNLDEAEIRLKYFANPPAQRITWSLPNGTVVRKPLESARPGANWEMLSIGKDITSLKIGMFIVSVTNLYGSDTVIYNVTEKPFATFGQYLLDGYYLNGTGDTIRCMAFNFDTNDPNNITFMWQVSSNQGRKNLIPDLSKNIRISKMVVNVSDSTIVVSKLDLGPNSVSGSGDLTCIVKRGDVEVMTKAKIYVRAPPQVSAPNPVLFVTPGRDAMLKCFVRSQPPPTRWRWFKGSNQLKSDKPHDITLSRLSPRDATDQPDYDFVLSLAIWKVDLSELGAYTCTVDNLLGRAKDDMILDKCQPGYLPHRFQEWCEDIDECGRQGFYNKTPCEYGCLNTKGSFKCNCPDGKELQPDMRSCELIKQNKSESSQSSILIGVSSGLGILVLGLLASVFVFSVVKAVRKKKERLVVVKRIHDNAKHNRFNRLVRYDNSLVPQDDDKHKFHTNIPYAQDQSSLKEFPRERLRVGEVIGQGRFGIVFQAEALNIIGTGKWEAVAVKQCKGTASDQERDDFFRELELVSRIPKHLNVVNHLGFCTRIEPVTLIMELITGGDLQSFLRQNRNFLFDDGVSSNGFPLLISDGGTDGYGFDNFGLELDEMNITNPDIWTRTIMGMRFVANDNDLQLLVSDDDDDEDDDDDDEDDDDDDDNDDDNDDDEDDNDDSGNCEDAVIELESYIERVNNKYENGVDDAVKEDEIIVNVMVKDDKDDNIDCAAVCRHSQLTPRDIIGANGDNRTHAKSLNEEDGPATTTTPVHQSINNDSTTQFTDYNADSKHPKDTNLPGLKLNGVNKININKKAVKKMKKKNKQKNDVKNVSSVSSHKPLVSSYCSSDCDEIHSVNSAITKRFVPSPYSDTVVNNKTDVNNLIKTKSNSIDDENKIRESVIQLEDSVHYNKNTPNNVCTDETKDVERNNSTKDDLSPALTSEVTDSKILVQENLPSSQISSELTTPEVNKNRRRRRQSRDNGSTTGNSSIYSGRSRRSRYRRGPLTADSVSVSDMSSLYGIHRANNYNGRLSGRSSRFSHMTYSDVSHVIDTDIQEEALKSKDLFAFGLQVARGMRHLTEHSIIHRDLAARNVLVTDRGVCKITDFGLARFVEDGDTSYERSSKGPLPIRWMPPEAMVDGCHNSKSDVWSFGVLLWEIVTLGASPYPGMSAKEVFKYVTGGRRMEQPMHCRTELYHLMHDCWAYSCNDRPSFHDVCNSMEDLLEKEADYINMELFETERYECLETGVIDERV